MAPACYQTYIAHVEKALDPSMVGDLVDDWKEMADPSGEPFDDRCGDLAENGRLAGMVNAELSDMVLQSLQYLWKKHASHRPDQKMAGSYCAQAQGL